MMKYTLAVAALMAVLQQCTAFLTPLSGGSAHLASSARRLMARKSSQIRVASEDLAKATAKDGEGESLRKNYVVSQIADKADLNKTQAEAALAAFCETVADSLTDGNKIMLAGFGTFEPRYRGSRKGRNPRTGEKLDIGPTVVPAFSPAKALKDQVKSQVS